MRKVSSHSIFAAVLPAVFIVIILALLSVRQIQSQPISHPSLTPLPGSPLSALEHIYPVESNQGMLSLNAEKIKASITYLLEQNNPKAAADLIYIVQANNARMLLDRSSKIRFSNLVEKYHHEDLLELQRHKDNLFSVYADIVNGIGATFTGTGIEIVLHDTRNPLGSIIAIQNPISGRRLGDSTTNFGLELIKDYAISKNRGSSFIGYGLALNDGRAIKSTTIPIYDKRFGLIGFICLNIDISSLDDPESQRALSFLENFTAVNADEKINELIDNSRDRS